MCRSVLNTNEETLHSPLFKPIGLTELAPQPPSVASQLLDPSAATARMTERNPGPTSAPGNKFGGEQVARTETRRSQDTSSLLQKAQAKLENLRNKFQRTLREPPCPQIPTVQRHTHQNGVYRQHLLTEQDTSTSPAQTSNTVSIPPLNLTALTVGHPGGQCEDSLQSQRSRERQDVGPKLVKDCTPATSSAHESPAALLEGSRTNASDVSTPNSNGKSSGAFSNAIPAAGFQMPPFVLPKQLQHASSAHQQDQLESPSAAALGLLSLPSGTHQQHCIFCRCYLAFVCMMQFAFPQPWQPFSARRWRVPLTNVVSRFSTGPFCKTD